jgi:cytochrome c oxidase subunit I+III
VIAFGLMFVGFNVAFFPLHQLGLVGMPRRVHTYLEELGWGPINLLSTVGAGVLALGILVVGWSVIKAMRSPARAPDDPWGADTLDAATTSPPPNANFEELPVVEGRWGRWEEGAGSRVVSGLATDRREVLLTTVIDAEPHGRATMPGPSAWPLALAIAVSGAFVGLMFTPWAVPIGAALAFAVIAAWMWPREHERTPPWKEDR